MDYRQITSVVTDTFRNDGFTNYQDEETTTFSEGFNGLKPHPFQRPRGTIHRKTRITIERVETYEDTPLMAVPSLPSFLYNPTEFNHTPTPRVSQNSIFQAPTPFATPAYANSNVLQYPAQTHAPRSQFGNYPQPATYAAFRAQKDELDRQYSQLAADPSSQRAPVYHQVPGHTRPHYNPTRGAVPPDPQLSHNLGQLQSSAAPQQRRYEPPSLGTGPPSQSQLSHNLDQLQSSATPQQRRYEPPSLGTEPPPESSPLGRGNIGPDRSRDVTATSGPIAAPDERDKSTSDGGIALRRVATGRVTKASKADEDAKKGRLSKEETGARTPAEQRAWLQLWRTIEELRATAETGRRGGAENQDETEPEETQGHPNVSHDETNDRGQGSDPKDPDI
ncbi:MAG: hypothetical protein L6R40_006518 [Gallowayella cf. fulva]|nr:MAG: hypothetical protein L6R40_006518 [Xanthomendoza cf. fulva]